MAAIDDYKSHAAQRIEAKRANLRRRMVIAAHIENEARREALLLKLMAEIEEMGAIAA